MSEDKKDQLITINVDGKDYEVPPGMNLIQAVEKYAQKEIPHYCYHEKLSVAGNCRMCLVEMGTPMRDRATGEPILDDNGVQKIGWMPKPAIACNSNTSPGLHIKTDSPLVKDCRNGIMEFLLVNHPLDCPICDQAGECRLQEFATEYGRGYSRFIEDKNVKPKRTRLGPRVTLDDERCILCSRCIRFSQEIAKDDVLGFVDRGSYSTLSCYPGKELANNYSLNTVDICPVGALTDTDFRFKMRVWFLKQAKSICTESSVGVNTVVWAREGKIYRITPRQNDGVNDTWMSDSGRRLYNLVESEMRLLAAKFKKDVVTTEKAIEKAVDILKGAKFGIVGNTQSSVEEMAGIQSLAKSHGAPVMFVGHIQEGDDLLISKDATPNTRGALLTGLTKALPYRQRDVVGRNLKKGEMKTLVVFNEDLIEAGVDKSLLEQVDIIYVGSQQNATSEMAKVVIPSQVVFEKAGSFVNQNFRLQKFEACIPAPQGVKSDAAIITSLRAGLGDEDASSSLAKIWESLSSDVKEFEDLSYSRIPDEGVQLDGSRFDQLNYIETGSLHYEAQPELAETA